MDNLINSFIEEFSQNSSTKNNSTITLPIVGGGYLGPIWLQEVLVVMGIIFGLFSVAIFIYIAIRFAMFLVFVLMYFYYSLKYRYHNSHIRGEHFFYHMRQAVHCAAKRREMLVASIRLAGPIIRIFNAYFREPDIQEMVFMHEHFHGESFTEPSLVLQPLSLITMVEQIYFTSQTIRMIIEVLKTDKVPTEDQKWYYVDRKHKLLTLFNSLFLQLTGHNFLAYYINDNKKALNGIVKYAADLCTDIADTFNPPEQSIQPLDPLQQLATSVGFDAGVYANQQREAQRQAYTQTSEHFHAESFLDGVETLHSISEDYMGVLDSEIGRKIRNLCSLLLCIPALNSIGFTPDLFGYSKDMIADLNYNYKFKSGIALPAIILEHSTHILLKFSQMMIIAKDRGAHAGVKSLFISRADILSFDNEYMWLLKNSKNFSCRTETVNPDGTPDPFTLEGYFNRCQQALDKLEKIIPSVGKDAYAKSRLERCRQNILIYQTDCAAELRSSESRPFPYAIMLTGPPSVGKSAIKDILFNQMHASDNSTGRFDVPYKPELVYTYNSTDDFYSGFSTAHTSILMDDIAQKIPEIIKQSGGDDLNDLIRIINSIPFLPNQAELEKKGKTPMRVRYVIGTTNTPDLNAYHVFNCPSAIYRRMIFVSCDVKPEYRNPGSTSLQGDLTNPMNMDLWDFTVTKYNLQGNSVERTYWDGEKFVRMPVTLDIEQISMFVHSDIDKHWTQQELAKKASVAIFESKQCQHGISEIICKRCASSLVGESSGGFVIQDVFALVVLIPIYLLFTIATLSQQFFPQPTVSRPHWSLRWARSLINYLPDVPLAHRVRRLRFVPSYLYNRICKTYFFDMYDSFRDETVDLYQWFRNDVLYDWRFPALIATIGILYQIKRIYRLGFIGQSSETRMPEPTEEEKQSKNYWLKQYKIGVFPNKGSTIGELELHNQVVLNTVLLQLTSKDGTTTFTNGFLLQGNLCVTVAHSLDAHQTDLDEIHMWRLAKSGEFFEITFKVDKTCLYMDKKRDLLYFTSNRIVAARDLTGYLPDDIESINIHCTGRMHYVNHNDTVSMQYMDIAPLSNKVPISNYTHCGNVIDARDCLRSVMKKPSHKGMCGAPVIALQGTMKMIAGIHVAGNGNGTGCVRPISLTDVKIARTILQSSVISDADKDVAFIANCDDTITKIHPKCPTNEMFGEYIKIGGHSLPRVAPRTSVKPSPICDEVVDYYSTRTEFNKVLHTSPMGCKPKEAIKLSMEKAFTNAQFYPEEIAFCVEAMSKEFLAYMSQEDLDRLHPYPISAAINGVDNIPYLDRLNLSTSGGFGHSGPKRKLFDPLPPVPEHQVQYEMNDDLLSEWKYILTQYSNHRVANPVFKCAFKDEPISLEKAKCNKVRIFSGSPTAFSIFARQFLMCIIREFVGRKRLCFEMAIGANAHGMDWDEIYHHVIRHGEDRCFAGDYKAFDKQMPPEIILGAFKVITNILRAASWDEADLAFVDGVAHDTAFPTMDLFGTLIECFGNNPSGHILTTPINSLANSLYMRIACRRILTKNNYLVTIGGNGVDFAQFRDVMSLVTYGDDNCGSTSDKYPCINHKTIQLALREAGIIYTTDDKEAESKGLVHVDSITFLKRRFVFSPELQRTVGPLLEESLFKALTYWTYSKTVGKEEQLAAVIDSVNREYFFYTREIFEDRHTFLKKLCVKHQIMDFLPDGKLNGWDDICMSLNL